MNKKLHLRKYALFISTLFLLLGFINALNAQSYIWAKNMGGTSLDNGLSVAVDASGNVYTTGYFQGTADFDPGPGVVNLTAFGSTDIFVSKLDNNGNLVWAKQLGGSGGDVGRSIKVDGSGNTYITGQFSGTADFDPSTGTVNLTSSGLNDIFVCKLNATGGLVFAKKMGDTGDDQGYSMVLDGGGNIYVTGTFNGTVDFDPNAGVSNLTSAGSYDIFISKLNPSGNFVWAKAMGSSSQDFGMCIALDVAGNVYTSGYFQGTADFDPGAAISNLTSVNARDIFVSKLDQFGNFVWAKQIGGSGNQTANAIAIDALNNIYITGSFEFTADFDPGTSVYSINSNGADDIFVCKLNQNGLFGFAKSMGSSGFDYGRGITVNAVGNVLITGDYAGTVDFDPGINTYTLSTPNTDAFICTLTDLGNFVAAINISSSAVGSSVGNAITSNSGGNIYATGMFSGTSDFDPGSGVANLASSGSQADVFVVKLNYIGTGLNETARNNSFVSVYPNPVHSLLTLKTEDTIKSVSIFNVMGTLVLEEKNNSFTVEQLPAGVYTLQIKTSTGIGVARFIKE
ncbi:MAG: SBBP repeat-containing protein [Sediminibacterium sp.]|nr:SBBP repeat-containing protein [Sediminibacterium sp.]